MPGDRLPALCVVDYSHIDSGLAEDGVFPVSVVCADRIENWADLDDDGYRLRKGAWLTAIVRRLDAEWPGVADAVVASTIATARSMQQHLNTPGGAIYGFALNRPEEYPKGPPQSLRYPGAWALAEQRLCRRRRVYGCHQRGSGCGKGCVAGLATAAARSLAARALQSPDTPA